MNKASLGLIVFALCFSSLVLGQKNDAKQTGGTTEGTNSESGPVFKVGHGVSAPKPKRIEQPELSKQEREKAKNAAYQGSVLLWMVVDADGYPRNIKVARGLSPDLDRKAIEAVKKWRFDPAKKDGEAVAVQINVEVNFHLY